MRRVRRFAGSALRRIVGAAGYELVAEREARDFVLHDYASYEDYRDTQIRHNVRKLDNVWADEATLALMVETLRAELGTGPLTGLCHGARNGFEQGYLNGLGEITAIGTDISPTATDFPDSVQWDFHDRRDEWVGAFDFVYSNSLDQSWNPRAALVSWLNQIKSGGCVVIEHTDAHGPRNASRMDPFGVRPLVMPYVLAEWFGFAISVRVVKGRKAKRDMDVWLFFVRRLVEEVA